MTCDSLVTDINSAVEALVQNDSLLSDVASDENYNEDEPTTIQ